MSRARTGRLLLALGAVLLLITGCSKRSGVSGWKATAEIVGGVKTIQNPETPKYGTFAFDLIEDLSIGNEKDDAYLFTRGAGVAVDDKGQLLVCDFAGRRVQVFDRSGRYVRTLGRQGQGPGEYHFPSSVMWDGDGHALINDASRSFIVYGPEGHFEKRVLLKTFLSLPMLGPGGTIVGTLPPTPRAEGGPRNTLTQLGPDGEFLRTLAEFPACGVIQDLVINHWYTCRLRSCLRSPDSLFYGFDLEYKFHVLDKEGRSLFVFSKDEREVPISSEEKALTRKEGIFTWSGIGDPDKTDLGMPDHRPFFSQLTSDDLGRLYVIRFKPIAEKDVKTSDVDVFSKDGYYLYRMTWPFVPQVIKGGFLYEVRQDEEAGLTKIIRHRIENWADFRAE